MLLCLWCNHQQSHPTAPTCHGVLQHIVVNVIIGWHRSPCSARAQSAPIGNQLITHHCGCPQDWWRRGGDKAMFLGIPAFSCPHKCAHPTTTAPWLYPFLPPTITTGDLQQRMSHAVRCNWSLLISLKLWETEGLFFRIFAPELWISMYTNVNKYRNLLGLLFGVLWDWLQLSNNCFCSRSGIKCSRQ